MDIIIYDDVDVDSMRVYFGRCTKFQILPKISHNSFHVGRKQNEKMEMLDTDFLATTRKTGKC